MKIEIYYHVSDFPAWQAHTDDQLNCLRRSGLWHSADRIHLQLHYNSRSFHSWLEQFDNDSRVTHTVYPCHARCYSEVYSMIDLAQQVRSHTEPVAVFRYHTKGVTRRCTDSWPLAQAWSNYLDYWNVQQWHLCYQALQTGYHTAGANWHCDANARTHGHWSGNIWWARSDYLSSLPELVLPHWAGFRAQLGGYSPRHDAELWVGSGSSPPHKLELHHHEHACVYHVPPPENYQLETKP